MFFNFPTRKPMALSSVRTRSRLARLLGQSALMIIAAGGVQIYASPKGPSASRCLSAFLQYSTSKHLVDLQPVPREEVLERMASVAKPKDGVLLGMARDPSGKLVPWYGDPRFL